MRRWWCGRGADKLAFDSIDAAAHSACLVASGEAPEYAPLWWGLRYAIRHDVHFAHDVAFRRSISLSPRTHWGRHRSDLGAVSVRVSGFESPCAIQNPDFASQASSFVAGPGDDALLVFGAVYAATEVRHVNVPLGAAAYDLICFHVTELVRSRATINGNRRLPNDNRRRPIDPRRWLACGPQRRHRSDNTVRASFPL